MTSERLTKLFIATISYLVGVGVLGLVLQQTANRNTFIEVMVFACIGFVFFFLWCQQKLLKWPPEPGVDPISQELMREKLYRINVFDFPFELIEKKDHYVLFPQCIDAHFLQALGGRGISNIYFMKIWINQHTHSVYFLDYVTSTRKLFSGGTMNFERYMQSGVMRKTMYIADSKGNFQVMDNSHLHNALINTVTQSGWTFAKKP
ncbi:hypothetical protein [Salinivibrio proteolyticus]|uniref:hypothetical protein n=1 Tax=Salinivibrio proteolyticus TaxID=334715 RepID=UPI001055D45B|nr:hypothetical protein [Salinivibrio proteolyticus]